LKIPKTARRLKKIRILKLKESTELKKSANKKLSANGLKKIEREKD